MTDIAPVGFSVDTSGLSEANAQLDAFNAKQQQVAAGSEQVAGATPAASTALKDFAGSAATAGTASEQAEARIAALSLGMGQMTEAATMSALSLQGIKAYAAKSAASLAALTASHTGFTSASHEAAGSTKELREALHLTAFEAEQMGASLGPLRGVLTLARGGVGVLATALGGALVIALELAGDKADILHSRIDAAFGKGAAFDELSASATRLGTSVATIEPGAETAYAALMKLQGAGSFAATDKLKAMGFGFAPGAAGQAAQDSLAAMNQQKLNPQALQDMQKLTELFKLSGETAASATPQAKALLAAIPAGASGARQAADTVNEEMTKLFQMTGDGATAAGKSTQELFAKIAAGGLTSKDVAALAPEVGNEIAQAFGYTGAGAVEKFEAALDRIGGASFKDFIAALLGVKPAIDAMTVPDTIANAWDHFETTALAALGNIEARTHLVSGALDEMAAHLTAAANGGGGGLLAGAGLGFMAGGPVGAFIGGGVGLIAGGAGVPQLARAADAVSPAAASAGAYGSMGVDPTANPWQLPPAGARMPAQSTATTGIPVDIVGVGTSASPITASTGALDGLPVSIVGTAPDVTTGSTAAMPAQQSAVSPGASAPGSATDQTSAALDQLDQGLGQTASGLSSASSAAQDTATQGSTLSGALSGIGSALSGAASAVASFVAQVEAAASGLGSGGGASSGGGSYGDQTGITAGQPSADIGSNALGGIHSIGGSGPADSLALTGQVSPGETVAVIPPGGASSDLLQQLQDAIGSSPISTGGAIGPNATGGIYQIGSPTSTIGSPASYAAMEALSAGAPSGSGNASQALANAVAAAGGQGGSPIVSGSSAATSLAYVMALAALKVPTTTITASKGKGGGGMPKIKDDSPGFGLPGWANAAFNFGGSFGGGAATSRLSQNAGGMVQNPDGSWSLPGQGHGPANDASAKTATARSVDDTKKLMGPLGWVYAPSQSNQMDSDGNPVDYLPADAFSTLGADATAFGNLTPSADDVLSGFVPGMGVDIPDQSTLPGWMAGTSPAGASDPFSTGFGGNFPGDPMASPSFDAGTPPSFDPGDFGVSLPPSYSPFAADPFAAPFLGNSGFDSGADDSGDFSGGGGGFATGGSFMVGGSGGTDKVPVSFMASSDERVTIETPAQQAARDPMASKPGFATGGSFIAGEYGFGGALGSVTNPDGSLSPSGSGAYPGYGFGQGGQSATPAAAAAAGSSAAWPSAPSGGGVDTFDGPVGGSSGSAPGWYSPPGMAPPAPVNTFGASPAAVTTIGGASGNSDRPITINVTTPNLASFSAPTSRLSMRRTANAMIGA